MHELFGICCLKTSSEIGKAPEAAKKDALTVKVVSKKISKHKSSHYMLLTKMVYLLIFQRMNTRTMIL